LKFKTQTLINLKCSPESIENCEFIIENLSGRVPKKAGKEHSAIGSSAEAPNQNTLAKDILEIDIDNSSTLTGADVIKPMQMIVETLENLQKQSKVETKSSKDPFSSWTEESKIAYATLAAEDPELPATFEPSSEITTLFQLPSGSRITTALKMKHQGLNWVPDQAQWTFFKQGNFTMTDRVDSDTTSIMGLSPFSCTLATKTSQETTALQAKIAFGIDYSAMSDADLKKIVQSKDPHPQKSLGTRTCHEHLRDHCHHPTR